MKEQFLEILKNGDKEAILPFLQHLSDKHKKELIPIIQKEEKYCREIIELSPNVYGMRGRAEQIYILEVSTFFCFDRKTVMKKPWWQFPKEEILETLLPVYCPDWFAGYISSHDDYRISYQAMMKWVKNGYIPLASPEKIAEMIEYHITNENLEQYEETLNEHIWYLFQYPTTLNWCQGNHWGIRIQELCKEKKMDRLRVLKECLLALNRNFNKNLTNWFLDLFLELDPTTDELIGLQDELFAALTCVQSKPVKCILELIKKLIPVKQFKTEEMLPYISMLVSSETKAVVNATLGVLQIILKTGTPYQQEICRQLTALFISKDESIQKKGATLLKQYAKPDEEIQNSLQGSEENLFSSVKTILKDWITPVAEPVPEPARIISVNYLIRDEKAIIYPQTYEDFAFFLNQAITLEEPFYLDVFMQGLLNWNNQVKAGECILLEPTIKKICKSLDTWEDKYILSLMGSLLYAWCCDLEQEYPKQMKKIMNLWGKLKETEDQRKKNHGRYPSKMLPVAELDLPHYYKGFRLIAQFVQEKMQTGDRRPLLSTPTHLPAWIDPVTLVKRIQQYQIAGKEPHTMDMQLAIQRCALDNTGEALALAQNELKGEIKELICFLLDRTVEPQGPFTYRSWWMTAAITRSPDTAFPAFEQFEYKAILPVYFSASHPWEASEQGTKYYNKQIRINTPGYKLRGGNPLFLEYLLTSMVPHKNFSTAFNKENIPFLLYAIPNRPDILNGFISSYYVQFAYEVAEVAMGQAGVSAMGQLDIPFRSMDYLALAGYMIGFDKTVREYAAQIWIDRVYQGRVDNKELGRAIGKIEYIEMFPLKRLIDLILNSMWNISNLHNHGLRELVEGIISESNPEPVKNMKKLLEIYKELLVLTGHKVSPEVIPILDKWKETSLKKIVVSIVG